MRRFIDVILPSLGLVAPVGRFSKRLSDQSKPHGQRMANRPGDDGPSGFQGHTASSFTQAWRVTLATKTPQPARRFRHWGNTESLGAPSTPRRAHWGSFLSAATLAALEPPTGAPISLAAVPSTDTLRDLILGGYEISIHCRAYPCTKRVKADPAAFARKHGLDYGWFGRRWPYRCDRCGSRDKSRRLAREGKMPRIFDLKSTRAQGVGGFLSRIIRHIAWTLAGRHEVLRYWEKELSG
jgi:hypothetical protein